MEIPDIEGDILSGYRSVRLLGKGSVTDTYLGEEYATGHKVVLKVVRLHLSPDEVATFLRTLQSYSQVLHPHLVRILAYGSSAGRPVLVTEHAPKGSLRQRHLRGTQLAPNVVRSYAKQIADALQHLHGQQLLHLNLKPENVLLREDGTLLVDDAYLAMVLGGRQQFAVELAERACYLAPEQIQGMASAASDQYALACLLYELLTGRPPFTGTFAEVAAQHLSSSPAPSLRTHVPTLEIALEQVLTCALAKDPAQRFASIRAFANAFEQACDEPATFSASTPKMISTLSQQAAQIPVQATPVLAPQGTRGQTPIMSSSGPTTPLTCQGCGHYIGEQDDLLCSVCGYPLKNEQEQRLLEALLRDLQLLASTGGVNLPITSLARLSDTSFQAFRRVAKGGGAHLTVRGLMQHYQRRLHTLSQAAIVSQPKSLAPSVPTADPARITANMVSNRSQEAVRQVPMTAGATAGPALSRQMPQTGAISPVTPPIPRTPRRSPLNTIRPLIESPAGLMVALGTFLLLIAILVLPFAFRGSPLPLPLTLSAQVFFVIMAITTRRSTHFRDFSGIYAGFFALTVPLLALDIFQSALLTDLPWLIGLAALYAAITYGAFAILQRFSPFGVLSVTALLVADSALTLAVTGSYAWIATTLLLLTAPGVAALPQPEDAARSWLGQLLTTSWDVLRRPITIFLWIVGVGITCIYIPLTSFLLLNSFSAPTFFPEKSTTVAFLVTLLILLAWFCNFVKHSRWRNGQYAISLLLLLSVLFMCYTFTQFISNPSPNMTRFLYGSGLLVVALICVSMSYWASPTLHLYLRPGEYLSAFVIVLLACLPFVVSPKVPQQIFLSIVPLSQLVISPLLLLDALLLGVGCCFSVLLAVRPLGISSTMAEQHTGRPGWPWLFLLSGLLFTWGFGTLGLGLAWLHVGPFWWFGVLTLCCMLVAVRVRALFEKRWSVALDVLTVFEALLTLWLGVQSQSGAPVSLALLSFGTLFYCVLLFQRRSLWLFLPWLFVLADLPHLLVNAAGSVLLLGLFLPFVATAVRRGMPVPRPQKPFRLLHEEQLNTPWQWDWPLVTFALMCGAFILVYGFRVHTGISVPWLNFAFPVAAEFVAFALVWYGMAALAQATWWLVPVGIFALATVILADQSFWALTWITVGSTLCGLVISRLTRRIWAWPCYITALLGALLTLPLSFILPQLTVSAWVLLGFAALAGLSGVAEAQPGVLWLVPLFTTASLLISLELYFINGQITNFLHLPAVALLSAAAAVQLGRVLRREDTRTLARKKVSRWRWLSPCYGAAFLAASLTGLSVLIIHTAPVPQLIPGLLFGYALLAFLVVIWERAPLGHILVLGFGVWGIDLSTRLYPNLLIAIGAGLLVLALLADRSLKYTGPWPLSSGGVRASWGLVWTLLAEITWISAGFFPTAFLPPVFPAHPVFVLLLLVVLFYLTGLVQRQGFLCLLTPLFALWPLWELTYQGAFFVLFLVFCGCLGVIVSADLLTRTLHVAQSVKGRLMLWYVLPIFLVASLAACLSGVAGSVFVPASQHGEAGGLLLIYSFGSWLVLRLMRQPRFIALTAAFGLWGVLLMMQTPTYIILSWSVPTDLVVTGLGCAATLLGLCTMWRVKPLSESVAGQTGRDQLKE